jgi:hypothetical protein
MIAIGGIAGFDAAMKICLCMSDSKNKGREVFWLRLPSVT